MRPPRLSSRVAAPISPSLYSGSRPLRVIRTVLYRATSSGRETMATCLISFAEIGACLYLCLCHSDVIITVMSAPFLRLRFARSHSPSRWNNWCQLNTFPVCSLFMCYHLSFLVVFSTASLIAPLLVFIEETGVLIYLYCCLVSICCFCMYVSPSPPSVNYSLCCQVLSVWAAGGLPDEKHHQPRPDQPAPGGPHHLDQL